MTGRRQHRVRLDGELTIVTAAERHAMLLAAVRDGADLDLDLAGVTDLDTAGLQVLLSARRQAADRDLTVRVRAASQAVRDVLALARLSTSLEPLPASEAETVGPADEPEA